MAEAAGKNLLDEMLEEATKAHQISALGDGTNKSEEQVNSPGSPAIVPLTTATNASTSSPMLFHQNGSSDVFACKYNCGFYGAFEAVDVHEKQGDCGQRVVVNESAPENYVMSPQSGIIGGLFSDSFVVDRSFSSYVMKMPQLPPKPCTDCSYAKAQSEALSKRLEDIINSKYQNQIVIKEVLVPVPQVKIVERVVDRYIEVPVERIVKEMIEVPVPVEKIVIREVPVEKIVEKVIVKEVEKIVERDPPAPPRHIGLGLGLEETVDGRIYVADIVDGFAASRNGQIRVNDTIIGIDGMDVIANGLNLKSLINHTLGPEGSSCTLSLSRDGYQFTVKLTRVDGSQMLRSPDTSIYATPDLRSNQRLSSQPHQQSSAKGNYTPLNGRAQDGWSSSSGAVATESRGQEGGMMDSWFFKGF